MSPGVKFKDAELIGIPTIVVVGRGVCRQALIEVKDRRTGERRDVPLADAVDLLVATLSVPNLGPIGLELPERIRPGVQAVAEEALVDDDAVADATS